MDRDIGWLLGSIINIAISILLSIFYSLCHKKWNETSDLMISSR